ncbi:MAG TPA: hypothetical protein VNZ52_12405 [Candidatus Thermoplasmatota archaeon]|nr:hypothetical protein [Candidatus Thermoplasmatota archaeon]
MKTTTVLTVLGLLLAAPLAAAQDNYPEPNSPFDRVSGAVVPTSAAQAGTVEYFDMYITCELVGFAPREATGGRFLCPGTTDINLVWGYWHDANKDGCIGSCGALGVSSATTDPTFKAASGVTEAFGLASYRNDGNVDVDAFLASGDTNDLLQNEYRPIGPNDEAHMGNPELNDLFPSDGSSAFVVSDGTAIAWADFRSPEEGASTRCIFPPRNTFRDMEGVYKYADYWTFNRLSGNGLGPRDLGIEGNTVQGTDLSGLWLGDDVKNAYNSSKDDKPGHSWDGSGEKDTGVAPTFDQFYDQNLAQVLGEEDQPSNSWGVINDLEQDGCNFANDVLPDEPETFFSFSASQSIDLNDDGVRDYEINSGSWTAPGAVNSPVGSNPLGTISNSPYWLTAYGYRASVGGKTGLSYAGVNPASTQGDEMSAANGGEGTLWAGHPVSWRDADCFDHRLVGTTYVGDGVTLLNNVRCPE